MIVDDNPRPTVTGPSEWFSGSVLIDPIRRPGDGSRLNAGLVHFAPGARTAWHTHPNGQTLWITQGVGLVARRGATRTVRSGDSVFFAPGEEHWHGAAPDQAMSHVSMVEVDDQGIAAVWGDHVTDDEYRASTGE